jgi:endonuclease YncB( thermonuclease family)
MSGREVSVGAPLQGRRSVRAFVNLRNPDHVQDGDSFRVTIVGGVLTDARQSTRDGTYPVRINGIDAHELDQDIFGQLARDALYALFSNNGAVRRGAVVYLETDAVGRLAADRNGRILARVDVDGTDVGDYMVRNGYAWAYFGGRWGAKTAVDPDLLALEQTLHPDWRRGDSVWRPGTVGLWASEQAPVEPNRWRRAQKEKRAAAAAAAAAAVKRTHIGIRGLPLIPGGGGGGGGPVPLVPWWWWWWRLRAAGGGGRHRGRRHPHRRRPRRGGRYLPRGPWMRRGRKR